MSELAEVRRVLAEVAGAGACAQPIRLRGRHVNVTTGELGPGEAVLRCGDRRAACCPSCSRLYKADAWHLVAAGLAGGKGIPDAVAGHPRLFVTLTAPSFGRVHTRPSDAGRLAPCHPSAVRPCRHGAPRSCGAVHEPEDAVVGAPLCHECFEWEDAVLFNAFVPALWHRSAIDLRRALAAELGVTARALGSIARLSYLKVAEFQRRGLVHLHVVLRVDGPDGPSSRPPARADAELLATAVRSAVRRARLQPPELAGHRFDGVFWGRQLDVRHLPTSDPEISTTFAAYVAKYTTKTVDHGGLLARRLRSELELEALAKRGVPPHLLRLARTAWRLGADPALRHLRLRENAHQLGYRGTIHSKSHTYSTTLGALRAARRSWVAKEIDTFEAFDGDWHYAGRGYRTPYATRLAEVIAELEADARQGLTRP